MNQKYQLYINNNYFPCQKTKTQILQKRNNNINNQMDFQQFIFEQQSGNWNKPSLGYQSTNLSSNHVNDQLSSSQSQKQKIPNTTKFIRKKYEPIKEGDKVYRYQDNPTQYKKLRKKIQNRLSANKVRGKKKNYVETLEYQVNELKIKNSQILLINAKLQSENSMLKERVNFLQKLSLKKKNQQADSYVTNFSSTKGGSSPQYQSPFENIEQNNWVRVTQNKKINKDWLLFAVFTIIIGVFIIPGSKNTEQLAMIAAKIPQYKIDGFQEIANKLYQNALAISMQKFYLKLSIIGIYILVLIYMIYKKGNILKKGKIKSF